MSVAITFRPLFVDGDKPLCSLLKIDNYNILLDCGWDENFNEEDLAQLREYVLAR